jgi:hypothetical protein
MPCFGTSVVYGRLTAETWPTIRDDTRAHEALARHLQQQTGLDVTQRWVNGELEFSFATGGRVTIGARGVANYAGRYGVPVDEQGFAEFADELAQALTIERTVAAFYAVGYVESDTSDSEGNRVLMVNA